MTLTETLLLLDFIATIVLGIINIMSEKKNNR